jgi:hypothetical protein
MVHCFLIYSFNMIKSKPTLYGIAEYRVLKALQSLNGAAVKPFSLYVKADVGKKEGVAIRNRLTSTQVIANENRPSCNLFTNIVVNDNTLLEKRIIELRQGHNKILTNRISFFKERLPSMRRILTGVNWGETVYLPIFEERNKSLRGSLRACLSVLHEVEVVQLSRLDKAEGEKNSGIAGLHDYYTMSRGSGFEHLWSSDVLDIKLLEVECRAK